MAIEEEKKQLNSEPKSQTEKPEAKREIGYTKRRIEAQNEGEKKKKKKPEKTLHRNIRFAIILVVAALLVVAIYVRVLNKTKTSTSSADAGMTDIERMMNRDMDTEYPAMARDVVSVHTKILKYLYNEKLSDEEIETLNTKVRAMFCEELLGSNPESTQLDQLKRDIKDSQKAGTIIMSTTVSPESEVKYTTMNGNDYAIVYATCGMKEGSSTKTIEEGYLLVKEDEKWKIVGWSGVGGGESPTISAE